VVTYLNSRCSVLVHPPKCVLAKSLYSMTSHPWCARCRLFAFLGAFDDASYYSYRKMFGLMFPPRACWFILLRKCVYSEQS